MSSTISVDSIQPIFDSSATKLAWATADGRVRIFQSRGPNQVRDITKDLSHINYDEVQANQKIYSCLLWGAEVSC